MFLPSVKIRIWAVNDTWVYKHGLRVENYGKLDWTSMVCYN